MNDAPRRIKSWGRIPILPTPVAGRIGILPHNRKKSLMRQLLVHRITLTLLFPLLLLMGGTSGYMLIEDWDLLDALYMTVITLTTVGYREVHALTTAGRIFTMILALGGIFTLLYAMTEVIRTVVNGEIHGLLDYRRKERYLHHLSNHTIVCGMGRMGRLVCQKFSAEGRRFVVIERRAELGENFNVPHGIFLHGDATADETLLRAGIQRAKSLVTVAASDADNLYITMSARLLSESIFIVARSEDLQSEQKLMRAGANRVISPYHIGGVRVAQAVLRPNVLDFIDLATRTEHFELQIEEVRISAGSPLAGVTIQDSQLRQQFGVIIVAIRNAAGKMNFNPSSDARMEAEDILIVIGPRPALTRLDQIALKG